jgi:hypothetical protein
MIGMLFPVPAVMLLAEYEKRAQSALFEFALRYGCFKR